MEFVIGGVILVLGIAIGIGIGIFLGTDRMRQAIESRTMGCLRVDHSEPDEPTRMFVELKDVTPDMIAKDEFVIFEVINENYLSQN